MIRVKYTWFGIIFGATFPCVATAIDIWARGFPFTPASVIVVQSSQPLHWIINTAPLFLGIFAWAAGKRQATAFSLNNQLEQKLIDLEKASIDLKLEMEERARLENQLKSSQKLESLGRLAGGVAHDFNNLLTVISGHVSIMGSEKLDAAETRAGLEEIQKATDRAAALTQQLLAYSRNQAAEPVNVDLNQEVESGQKMLRQLLGLVEDEPQIMQLALKSLSRIGYTVLAASSAEQALAIWATAREKVQILVLDVVLPGMNGKQLADKLLEVRPELPVIYISGYGANLISQYGLLANEIEFIQKPFTPAELINRVRLALDASVT